MHYFIYTFLNMLYICDSEVTLNSFKEQKYTKQLKVEIIVEIIKVAKCPVLLF